MAVYIKGTALDYYRRKHFSIKSNKLTQTFIPAFTESYLLIQANFGHFKMKTKQYRKAINWYSKEKQKM